MGLVSWLAWLGDDIEKLELVLSMTKDKEQRKVLEEVINDLKAKVEK